MSLLRRIYERTEQETEELNQIYRKNLISHFKSLDDVIRYLERMHKNDIIVDDNDEERILLGDDEEGYLFDSYCEGLFAHIQDVIKYYGVSKDKRDNIKETRNPYSSSKKDKKDAWKVGNSYLLDEFIPRK